MFNGFTFKCCAAALLVAAGAAGGKYRAMRLSEREKMIEDLIGGVRLFRSEIYYTHDRLARVADRLSRSCTGCASVLFHMLYEELIAGEGMDTEDLWKNAVLNTFKRNPALTEKDRAVLISAGTRLGRDDIEGQCLYLEKTEEELRVRLEEARREKETKSSLYKTLGVAVGSAAAILVL